MSLAFNPSSAKATKNGGRAEACRQESSHMLDMVSKPPNGKTAPRRSPEENSALELDRIRKWVVDRVAAAQSEPISEFVTLTPALARVLLEKNEANRPMSKLNVERMARDILAGRWEINGESLIISNDGNLNDGQHRCHAVIEADRPVRSAIVFGTRRESRFTLDQGVSRTVSHFLGMNGHADANALATVCVNIWQWREKGRLSRSPEMRPTKSETLLVAEHFKDIPDSLAFVSQKGAATVASRGLLAFCHWAVTQKIGSTVADDFIERLISGRDLRRGDALLYTRNRLIETRGEGDHGKKAELIFRAFNADRRGEKVDRIAVTGKQLPKLEK